MRVLNKRSNAVGVYIGRPSKWGNPFVIGKDGTRQDVIEKYRAYALATFSEAELETLRGQDLVCWCAPQACHGDVLIELVKENA
jgi:hypothetical protein